MADYNEKREMMAHAATIVSAYVSHNQIPQSDLPGLIGTIARALDGASTPAPLPTPPAELKPAVSVRKSVTDDYIICLEDGAKLRTLRRYLKTHFGMTPEAYREKWSLPPDYPMVAPSYSKLRSQMAKSIGLGRKASGRRGRPKLSQ